MTYNYNFIVATLIVTFALTVQAKSPNGTCTRSSDCTAGHSMCSIASPTCGGICQCIPGFAYDEQTGNCRRAVYLGSGCQPKGDVCVGENLECSAGGSCTCAFGFKPGMQGTDCVPNLMTQTAGQKCHDSGQCFYSLVCVENKCGCYTGYKPFGKHSCSPRQVYDSCTSNADCQMAPNSVCKNNRCECYHGYHAIQYQADIATKAYSCVGSHDHVVTEGQPCNTDEMKGPLIFCKVPYVCSPCGKQHICLRNKPVFVMSHASSVNSWSPFIIGLAVLLQSVGLF